MPDSEQSPAPSPPDPDGKNDDRPESKGERRRRAIIEAAERCFGRDGFWIATTAEIAKAAGVTQPALYRYFPTKQALFVEALALRQAEIGQALAAALRTPGTARSRIERISEATLGLVRRYPDMAKLRLQAIVVAAHDPIVRDAVRGTMDQLLSSHRALIDAAKADGSLPASVDSEVLAATISAYATQVYVAMVLDHPVKEIAERALPSLLRMIDDSRPRRVETPAP